MRVRDKSLFRGMMIGLACASGLLATGGWRLFCLIHACSVACTYWQSGQGGSGWMECEGVYFRARVWIIAPVTLGIFLMYFEAMVMFIRLTRAPCKEDVGGARRQA